MINKSIFLSAATAALITFIIPAAAQTYKVPPTSSSYGSVPVISDLKMEECVKLYNEAEWLYKKLNSMYVDQYSSASVDEYNTQVNRHSKMINRFNSECAGKQSQSAYEAAQRLNNQQR
ncbi:hypothetical protein MSG37_02670 [Shewanella sp. 1CM18E]|uniref:hypothetical protein n=1 Tax=Shewanella sp. 1CM18E TaxID=2929169 RepID=UPI0020BDB926|nr:hypothetical protein [Shewanella sp. 1CM18E]MCK8043775.1 hypothetical protein [Shewanella sp. 1CM18E]